VPAVKQLARVVAILAVGLAACGDWPPVVETVSDVHRLPAEQRDVRCVKCGQAEVDAIAQRLRGLDYLFFNSESTVTDPGIRAIATIRTLRQLVVRDASQVSDEGVKTLSGMPSLRELMLYDAARVSDKGLLTLADSRGLVMLYVSGAPHVTEGAVQQLRTRMPNCSVRVDAPDSKGDDAAQQGVEADEAR
jgi:hypothetical protein